MGLSMLLALGMRVKGRTDMGLGMIQGVTRTQLSC